MVSLGDNSKMRADIPLYIIAVICFISATILHLYPPAGSEPSTYTVILAVLGAIFAGVGYSMRPRQIETVEAVKETTAKDAVTETETRSSLQLVDVKGIGPKRAEQLRSIGIQSVEELAKQSSEELSKKAHVSTKIAGKWIEEAKKTLEEEKQQA